VVFFCYILPKFRYEKNEKQNTDPHLADMLKLIYAAILGGSKVKIKKSETNTLKKLHFFTEIFGHFFNK
jgi:hypothetical protein